MTREEMIEAVSGLKTYKKNKAVIFKVASELGLHFKDTNCGKCLSDYVSILKEQLGLISSAADESAFDNSADADGYMWEYTRKYPVHWKGITIGPNTPQETVREFVKRVPNGYFRLVKVEKPQTAENEEHINNEESL